MHVSEMVVAGSHCCVERSLDGLIRQFQLLTHTRWRGHRARRRRLVRSRATRRRLSQRNAGFQIWKTPRRLVFPASIEFGRTMPRHQSLLIFAAGDASWHEGCCLWGAGGGLSVLKRIESLTSPKGGSR